MAELWCGTASWSEESWEGVFYPPGTAPADYLTYYATQFDTVEANVTYYRIPGRRMVEGWSQKTPVDFRLSAKFPRSIVHAGDGPRPDPETLLVRKKVGEEVESFLESMDMLGPKCGPLVLQFPYFNRQVFPGIEPFLERLDGFLDSLPDRFRYGVEIRNRNWLGTDLVEVRSVSFMVNQCRAGRAWAIAAHRRREPTNNTPSGSVRDSPCLAGGTAPPVTSPRRFRYPSTIRRFGREQEHVRGRPFTSGEREGEHARRALRRRTPHRCRRNAGSPLG